MKKTVLIALIVVAALAILGIGAVYAQGQNPPFSMPMMGQGGGWMHEYVQQALAARLGLTEAQVEEKLAAGQTMYQVALDAGILEADIPAVLTEVHKAALDKAVADGAISREWADRMLQGMQGKWANGGGAGNCPMHNGGAAPNRGSGFQGGPGMMGRWQNE